MAQGKQWTFTTKATFFEDLLSPNSIVFTMIALDNGISERINSKTASPQTQCSWSIVQQDSHSGGFRRQKHNHVFLPQKSLAIWGLNSCLTYECIFKRILLLIKSIYNITINWISKLIMVNHIPIIEFAKEAECPSICKPFSIGSWNTITDGRSLTEIMFIHGGKLYSAQGCIMVWKVC